MKGRAVHAAEGKGRRHSRDRQAGQHEINEAEDLVKQKKNERGRHNDQELPRRYGADDLVFDVDELWDNELLRHTSYELIVTSCELPVFTPLTACSIPL